MNRSHDLRAVVFDLDGLIANTEDLYEKAGEAVLARRGKTYDTPLREQMMGRPVADALQIMIDCHALSYLHLCATAGIEVVAYEDQASGTMAMKDGRMRFIDVLLAPKVVIAAGDRDKAIALHEEAHRQCFIANSVNFPVRHQPSVERR